MPTNPAAAPYECQNTPIRYNGGEGQRRIVCPFFWEGVDGIEAGRCSVFHARTNPTTPPSMNLIVAAGPGYIKRNEKVERKAAGFSASRLLSPFFFLFPSTLATVRL
jgi:hypothetical protein